MPRERDTPEERNEPALSLKDLLIAAVSSAGAALIVSQIWREGTLLATAMTPVIVTIARELLARPKAVASQAAQAARAVTPVTPHLPKPSRFSRGRERLSDRSRRPTAEREQEEFDPIQPQGWDDLGRTPRAAGAPRLEPEPEPPDERKQQREARREEDRRRRWTRKAIVVGLVTGLAGCLIAVAVITFTEVAVFGKNASATSGTPTTFFSGSSRRDRNRDQDSQRESSEDKERDAESNEPDATPTPTPDATATPGPDATQTPAPSATPTPAPADGATPAAPTPEATPPPGG